MAFSLRQLLDDQASRRVDLHRRHANHQLVRVLQLTGFDVDYAHASGSWLTDHDGNRYLDLLSGFGVFALGRNHPTVKAALSEALAMDLPHLVQLDAPLPAGLLAERLCELAGPGIERCFFGNSGAEAVETAIKLSRRVTGKPRILHADNAFHGLTTGALALNGGDDFRAGFGALLDTTAVLYGDLDALERELRRGDVAAFVVEPIQGKSVEVATGGYLRAARDLCHERGALFVVDEVQTGIGRTGAMFAYQHADVVPDIVTVAKALSGGFVPVGATLCRDDVWQATWSSVDRALVHSSTFGQSTLAMVAGLATLSVIEDEGLVDHAASTGVTLADGLRELQRRHEVISDVRGRGLMVGVELDQPGRLGFRMLETVRPGLFSQLVVGPLFNDHRIITQVAADHVNLIKLLPPLVAAEPEVTYFLDALDDVLTRASKLGSSTARLGRDFARRARPGSRKA